MTCHNRVATTLRCLERVLGPASDPSLAVEVFLVDDGSTDGTSEQVRERFPDVHVIAGSGNLFWNGGMHEAFGAALERGFDFYLWLNDDSLLHDDAVATLVRTHDELVAAGHPAAIVIGAMQDPDTGEFTYGGYQKYGKLHPLRLRLVPPAEEPVQCTSMCGNLVLIPRSVAERVGNMATGYLHRWGDVDYGLRAIEAGCEVFVAPGYTGYCAANPKADIWRNTDFTLARRFAELHDVKGVQKEDWLQFTRRHGGPFWFVVWARPYLEVLVTHAASRLGRKSNSGNLKETRE